MSILNKAVFFQQHLSWGVNAHSKQENASVKCFSSTESPGVAVTVSIL